MTQTKFWRSAAKLENGLRHVKLRPAGLLLFQ